MVKASSNSATAAVVISGFSSAVNSVINDGLNTWALDNLCNLVKVSSSGAMTTYPNSLGSSDFTNGLAYDGQYIYSVCRNAPSTVFNPVMTKFSPVTLASTTYTVNSLVTFGGAAIFDGSSSIWVVLENTANSVVQMSLSGNVLGTYATGLSAANFILSDGVNMIVGDLSGTTAKKMNGAQPNGRLASYPTNLSNSATGTATSIRIGLTYTNTNSCATSASCSATCVTGTYVISCGASDSTLSLSPSCYAASPTTCTCNATAGTGTITVYPVCGRAQ